MYYIFHGDDEHSQRETLADLQQKLGDLSTMELNTSRFDGRSLSFSELQHACDSIPFLSKKRLVIVDNLLRHEPAYLDDLITYLPHLPESTRLVFIETRKVAKNHPLLKAAQGDESAYVKLFTRPEGGQLEKWVRQRVKSAGGQIAPKATHLLALNVGNDLALLDNEIEKLVLYKGREIIESEDVSLLCPYVAEASIFEMVDAIGTRHGRTAARLLQEKLNDGSDPFYLFSMIVRQFRLLIQVKELTEAGNTPPEIAQRIKIHPFVAGKLHQQSHNFSMAQLEQIYGHLLEMDVGVKTGKMDMTTALHLLVAGVVV